MKRHMLHILVLLCTLPLILPPGWCCFLISVGCCAHPTTPAPDEEKPASCCHCTPEQTDEPAELEKPTQSPPSRCGCLPREAVKPNVTSLADLDQTDTLAILPATVLGNSPSFPAHEAHNVSPPELRSHLLNCVWLC